MNDILMYGTVGYEITAERTIEELSGRDGDVTVRVHSYGGDAFEGWAVMNALRAYPGHVTVVVDGVAASAASVIAVGGADRLVMGTGTELMIHDAWCWVEGNANEMTKVAADLERTSQSMAEMYAEKAGGDAGQWRDMMRSETYFSAREAVEAGLADSVEDSRSSVDQPVLAKVKPRFAYAGRVRAAKPKILEEKNMTFAHEVAKRLGLATNGVAEADVLAALDETLAAQNEANDPEPVGTPEPADEAQVLDAAAVRALIEEVIGAKGDNGEQETPEPDDAEDDVETESEPAGSVEPAPAEFSEEPQEDSDAPEMVSLDKETYEELKKAAEAGWAAVDEKKQRDEEAEVNQWVAEGRIAASARQRALAVMKQNPDAARATFGAAPKGTIPRAEIGYGIDPVAPESTSTPSAEDLSKLAKSRLASGRK